MRVIKIIIVLIYMISCSESLQRCNAEHASGHTYGLSLCSIFKEGKLDIDTANEFEVSLNAKGIDKYYFFKRMTEIEPGMKNILEGEDFTLVFPEELSLMIFTFLNLSELAKVLEVNWIWHRIGNDQSIWKKMFFVVLNKTHPMLRRLVLNKCVDDFTNDWKENLKKLVKCDLRFKNFSLSSKEEYDEVCSNFGLNSLPLAQILPKLSNINVNVTCFDVVCVLGYLYSTISERSDKDKIISKVFDKIRTSPGVFELHCYLTMLKYFYDTADDNTLKTRISDQITYVMKYGKLSFSKFSKPPFSRVIARERLRNQMPPPYEFKITSLRKKPGPPIQRGLTREEMEKETEEYNRYKNMAVLCYESMVFPHDWNVKSLLSHPKMIEDTIAASEFIANHSESHIKVDQIVDRLIAMYNLNIDSKYKLSILNALLMIEKGCLLRNTSNEALYLRLKIYRFFLRVYETDEWRCLYDSCDEYEQKMIIIEGLAYLSNQIYLATLAPHPLDKLFALYNTADDVKIKTSILIRLSSVLNRRNSSMTNRALEYLRKLLLEEDWKEIKRYHPMQLNKELKNVFFKVVENTENIKSKFDLIYIVLMVFDDSADNNSTEDGVISALKNIRLSREKDSVPSRGLSLDLMQSKLGSGLNALECFISVLRVCANQEIRKPRYGRLYGKEIEVKPEPVGTNIHYFYKSACCA
ncbi:MAG: F-box protein [Elusimicrobiota bacterium]